RRPTGRQRRASGRTARRPTRPPPRSSSRSSRRTSRRSRRRRSAPRQPKPHSRPRRPRRCDSPSRRSTASLAATWTCCPAPTSPSSKPRRSRSPHSSSREARGQSSRARARPPPKPPSPPPTSSPRRSKTDSEEKHMAVDVYRGTSNIALPADVSSEIWTKVQDASVVMGLARKVTLPGTGVTFQEILTDPTPAFVGETDRKPVSNPTFAKKVLKPHKIAVVSTYSDETTAILCGLSTFLAKVGL